MANDTYTIIHHDSADAAHIAALADLVTAGGVDMGSGIVDSNNTWNAAGILDGSSVYQPFGIYAGGNYFAGGILTYDSAPAEGSYSSWGILDSSGARYESGIYASGYYPDGVFDGIDRVQYGVFGLIGGIPTVGSFGMVDYNSNLTTSGILDRDSVSYPYGILYDLGGYPTHAERGIYDGTYYTAQPSDGVYLFSYEYGVLASILNDGLIGVNVLYEYGIFNGYSTQATGCVGNVNGSLTAGSFGMVDNNSDFHDTGILDGQYGHHVAGIFVGGDDGRGSWGYYASGIYYGNYQWNEYGLIYDLNGTPTYAPKPDIMGAGLL